MKPSILFIVPATYEDLKNKGVEDLILKRDENGFFGKVITLHPFSNTTCFLQLNDCHEVYEIGFDLLPRGKNNRLFYYLQLPIHFFRIVFKTLKLTKKYNLNLIRANDPYWMGLFGYICSRICKIPFCVSIHADYENRIKLDKNISIIKVFGSYKIAKKLERFILARANMILPIRQSLAVKAFASGAKEDKVKVIPHGIDLTPFNSPTTHKTRQLFNINSTIKIISFVGRLSKDNYIDDILEVCKKLGKKRKDFLIIMAGGGKEENRIKKLVASDSLLHKHILLAGFKPREVCLDIRRTSDVSLCLMGGFSLIEACAAERPVVSYDVEWHSELVKNNETGFLIAENDVGEVVKALDWLFNHPDKCKEMGQKAKNLAFERHDLKVTSTIKTSCYKEMIKLR
tara:strand:+ start:1088 stop:2287 length:1200 start_codon:yes stop_codon:yes gene_type:complete